MIYLFKGKLTRSAYWGRVLLWLIGTLTMLCCWAYVVDHRSDGWVAYAQLKIVLWGLLLVSVLYLLSIMAKRLRDTGITAWIAPIVLLIGPIGLGVLGVIPSSTPRR